MYRSFRMTSKSMDVCLCQSELGCSCHDIVAFLYSPSVIDTRGFNFGMQWFSLFCSNFYISIYVSFSLSPSFLASSLITFPLVSLLPLCLFFLSFHLFASLLHSFFLFSLFVLSLAPSFSLVPFSVPLSSSLPSLFPIFVLPFFSSLLSLSLSFCLSACPFMAAILAGPESCCTLL